MRLTHLLPLALAGAIAAPALAQQADLQLLREIGDLKLMAATGAELGEIDDVLVDESGRPSGHRSTWITRTSVPSRENWPMTERARASEPSEASTAMRMFTRPCYIARGMR